MASNRILFVNRFFHPDHSATSQILGDLSFALAHDGVVVEVITSRLLYGDAGARLPSRECVQGVTVHRAWSTRFGRQMLLGRALDYCTFYVGAAALLLRLCDPNTTVVVKTDPPLLSVVVTPIAKWRGSKVINWLQDLFPEVAAVLGMRFVRKGALLRITRSARNASLRSAAMNVVLGRRMAALLAAEGVDKQRIRIIHNWADGDAISPLPPAENSLRLSWGLSHRFVVGYSGNLGRAHEFRTILGAAAILADRKDVAFLFIGAGAQESAVREEALQLGLKNVSFQPYQPREILRESLSVPDVHLVSLNPALEGLIVPSKFYGIAAAGRPTIFVGAADGEIPDILAESNSGYSVSVGDSAQLALLITKLADTPGLAECMGENARKVFLQRYTRRIAYEEWKTVLRNA
jgi:glycosyltransferase involved in cell wall biosynthesis